VRFDDWKENGGRGDGRPISQPRHELVTAELDWLDDLEMPHYANACQTAAQQVVQASEQQAFKLVAEWFPKRRIVMISLHSAAVGYGRLAPMVCDAIRLRRA
jgi:hypothetical protein